MIKNKYLNKILNIIPLDERHIELTLRGTAPYTFINTYHHTSANCKKNEERYKILTKRLNDAGQKGPTYTGGTLTPEYKTRRDKRGT